MNQKQWPDGQNAELFHSQSQASHTEILHVVQETETNPGRQGGRRVMFADYGSPAPPLLPSLHPSALRLSSLPFPPVAQHHPLVPRASAFCILSRAWALLLVSCGARGSSAWVVLNFSLSHLPHPLCTVEAWNS